MPPAPQAVRFRTPGWRDPRLVIGLLIISLSVLGGSVLFAHADDTTVVWSVRRSLPPGSTIAAGDLEGRRVGLDDVDLTRYLTAAGRSPVGQVLGREVGAGELLPAAALVRDGDEVGVRIPLAVAVTDVPASVEVGTEVDVWVIGEDPAGSVPAQRAFPGVRVVAIDGERDSFVPDTLRSVVVLVPGDVGEVELGRFLGRAAGGRVLLTQGDVLR